MRGKPTSKKEAHSYAWIFFAILFSILSISTYTLWQSNSLFYGSSSALSSSSNALQIIKFPEYSSRSHSTAANSNDINHIADVSVRGDKVSRTLHVDINRPLHTRSSNLVLGYFEDDTYQPYSLELFLSSIRTVAADATVLLMCPSPVQASVRELAVAKRAIVLEYDAASIQVAGLLADADTSGGEDISNIDPGTAAMLLLHDLLAGNSSVFHGVNKILITGVNNIVFQHNPFFLADKISRVGCFVTPITGWKRTPESLNATSACFGDRWKGFLHFSDINMGNIFIGKTPEIFAMLKILQNIVRGNEPSFLSFPSCLPKAWFSAMFYPLLNLGVLSPVVEVINNANISFVDAYIRPIPDEHTHIHSRSPYISVGPTAPGESPLFYRGYRYSEKVLKSYLDKYSDHTKTATRISSVSAQKLITSRVRDLIFDP